MMFHVDFQIVFLVNSNFAIVFKFCVFYEINLKLQEKFPWGFYADFFPQIFTIITICFLKFFLAISSSNYARNQLKASSYVDDE